MSLLILTVYPQYFRMDFVTAFVAAGLLSVSSGLVNRTTDLRFYQPVLNSTNMSLTGHFVTTSAGVQMPRFIYGTAWKKDRTTDLVVKAVLAGFRGIDSANQEKHYREVSSDYGVAYENRPMLYVRNMIIRSLESRI